jgi:hypothetical protein
MPVSHLLRVLGLHKVHHRKGNAHKQRKVERSTLKIQYAQQTMKTEDN